MPNGDLWDGLFYLTLIDSNKVGLANDVHVGDVSEFVQ